MSRQSNTPLEAVVLPDLPPPRSNRWAFIRVSAAFAAVLMLVAGLIWGAGQLITAGRGASGDPRSLVDHWEEPQERLANIARAMNSREVGASAGENRDFQRLFTRITSASRNGDDQAYRDCIDMDLLLRRVSRHPAARSDRSFSSWSLRTRLEDEVEGPGQVGECSIVHVERGERADLALVYTVDWAPASSATARRWWLVRSGRNWRLFDWERLDYEQSLAFGWAVQGAIAGDQYGYNYTALRNAVDAVDYPRVAAWKNEPRQQVDLARLIDQPLPAIIHDEAMLDLAWSLVEEDRPAEAIRACEAMTRPDDHPGQLIVRAWAHSALGRGEQALADVRRYQEIAGRDPLALAEQARALEELKRYSESAECWRQMLELVPNHTEALSEFCRLADASQRGRLTETMLRLRQPMKTAIEQAQGALYRDDIEVFDWFAAFIQSQSPLGAEVDVLKAHRLKYEGLPEQAAALYRQASQREKQPQNKEAYFQEFLSAMVAADQAAAGYAAADDPRAAFEYLTAGMEEDEAIIHGEQLRQLVAAHRKRVPGDARAAYYDGKLLLDEGKYEAADARFRSVLNRAGQDKAVAVKVDKDRAVAVKADNEVIDYTVEDFAKVDGADEEVAELCRSGRIEALFRLGKWKDAYQTLGQSPEVFRELAQHCEGAGAWDQLRELIVQHQTLHRGDRWIDYYEAKDKQHRGDAHGALAALARAERGDETLQMYCRGMKTDLLIAANEINQAYATSGDRSQFFVDLAGHLTQAEDWDRLEQLAELHRNKMATDLDAMEAWTDALWRQGQYDEIVAWLARGTPLTDHFADSQMLDERMVRSCLRLGRLADARSAANRASSERNHDVPLIMVLLAEGKTAEVAERLKNPQLRSTLQEMSLHDDPELKQLLDHPDLEATRSNFVWPFDASGTGRQGRVILFCRDTRELTATELTGRLKQIAGQGAAVVEIPPVEGERRRSFRIEHDGETLMCTIGPGPYWKAEGPEQAPRDAALAAILRDSAGFIVLEHDRNPNQPLRHPSADLLGLLAANLTKGDVQAIHGFSQSSGYSRLVQIDPGVIEQLRSGQFLRRQPADVERFHVYDSVRYSEDDEGTEAAAVRRGCRQAVTRIARKFQSGQPISAEVCVQSWRGHARERLWLKVVGAKSERYGGWQLHGELPADSTLWPHLRAGMRVVVQPYDVVEVRGE